MLQRGAILSGKYRIDSVLGEGGMAVVYAVTHLRNTARLAVKMLHADSVRKGHVRSRFVREGKVANSVHHAGAVQMLDDGVADDGSPYLVMEHLLGVSVAELGARAIPLEAALNIAYQVLDVLQAAHENGIIHRDIKPANLFVLRDGRVKVLDFGISRLHDGAEPFDSAASGAVMGTPFFMAPEQTRTDAREIDTRTDLFAVGATLFTLISGKYLHTGDDSQQVMIQAGTRQARSLASVAPATPRAVVDLVAKAVAYERAARWESAQAMKDAVREVHEALCGPIRFEALASLLREREFRQKSHAKLTAARDAFSRAVHRPHSSPLSTTLPAVVDVDVTRSRESFRVADPANHDAPGSRISAAPYELAGWAGHVHPQVEPEQGLGAHTTGSRVEKQFGKARALRVAAAAGAVCAAILALQRCQAAPRAVAAPPLPRPEISAPAQTTIPATVVPSAAPNIGLDAPPPKASPPTVRKRPKPLPAPTGSAGSTLVEPPAPEPHATVRPKRSLPSLVMKFPSTNRAH